MEREDIKMLVKMWWDVYNDTSLDYNPAAEAASGGGGGGGGGGVMKPVSFREALSKAGVVNYVTAPSAA